MATKFGKRWQSGGQLIWQDEAVATSWDEATDGVLASNRLQSFQHKTANGKQKYLKKRQNFNRNTKNWFT